MPDHPSLASTVDDVFNRTVFSLAALLALPTLPACNSENSGEAPADKPGSQAAADQNDPPKAADNTHDVAPQNAEQSPDTPDTKPADVEEPVPSVAWSCLCYYRRIDGGREPIAACRPTTQECEKLESRTREGSRTIIANSLSHACREIGNSIHPADLLGNRDSWRASSKPGSYILPGLCPLKLLPGEVMTAENFDTTIGPLALGISGKAVIKALGPPESKGKTAVEPATGDMLQDWSYESQGLKLTMSHSGNNVNLSDVLVKAPSTLKTREGIGIGSSFKEARTVYSSALASEDEQFDPNVLVVGSIYGGLFVTKKKGVVSELFLGAGAE